MLDMVLVLEPPTYLTRKLILEKAGMMGGFRHLIVIEQHIRWYHIGLRIIQLLLLVVLHLVLLLINVRVMWIIGPPNFTINVLTVGLMVVILFYLRSGIIYP